MVLAPFGDRMLLGRGFRRGARRDATSRHPLLSSECLGSVRTERQGIKFARFLDAQLRKRGHASTLIDPLQYRFPLLDKMYKE